MIEFKNKKLLFTEIFRSVIYENKNKMRHLYFFKFNFYAT